MYGSAINHTQQVAEDDEHLTPRGSRRAPKSLNLRRPPAQLRSNGRKFGSTPHSNQFNTLAEG